MNKAKTKSVKKNLVRNPEQPVLIAVVNKASQESQKPLNSNKASVEPLVCPIKNKTKQNLKFNVPEMHSTLKISKKIDDIVKPRQTKSVLDVDKNKLAVDEKISRKVNFPYDQTVFKNLIPLCSNEIKIQQFVAIKGPVYQKDEEPNLADFLQERKSKIYYHEARITIKCLDDKKLNIPMNNSIKLYNLLQINEEFRK